jgi:ribonucleoside-diphosphate reductase alpha chain
VRKVEVDRSRDALLTDFGKTTLEDRYLLPGESYQDMFARVSTAFADDAEHAQRVYDYMSQLWFMPSTPVLSNGGAERGLPISCFLNAVNDSLDGILGVWNENVWLAANGGGIGTYWGGVRSIGEKVKGQGQTSGIIPFIRVMDSLTLAISQGSLRRGSAAVYLDIHHPEIEEFLEIRKASGDFNRKSLNLHHGISITDEFMHAVRDGAKFGLRSPKTNEVLREVDARALWQKVLELRLQTGEPYLIFSDTVNRAMPSAPARAGPEGAPVEPVQRDHAAHRHRPPGPGPHRGLLPVVGQRRDLLEWRDHPTVHRGYHALPRQRPAGLHRPRPGRGLDRRLRRHARALGGPGPDGLPQLPAEPERARSRAPWPRAGTCGCSSTCAARPTRPRSRWARKRVRARTPPIAARWSASRTSWPSPRPPRSRSSAAAPVAGIEPIPANIYTHKTLSGSFAVKNPYLEKLLDEKGQNTDAVWGSILENEGSVQHLDFLSQDDKDVYKTAFELDQRWVVELAADRTPEICQSQSVNIFLPGDVDKWDLHMLHWQAWERGVKSLYYLRSKSVQRAAYAGSDVAVEGPVNGFDTPDKTDYEECLACQ